MRPQFAAANYTTRFIDQTQQRVLLARREPRAITHISGIKDTTGCANGALHSHSQNPEGRNGVPMHFHAHDTSGIAAASELAGSTRAQTPSTAQRIR